MTFVLHSCRFLSILVTLFSIPVHSYPFLLHSCPFLLQSYYILVTFLLHSYYILVRFLLHYCYILIRSYYYLVTCLLQEHSDCVEGVVYPGRFPHHGGIPDHPPGDRSLPEQHHRHRLARPTHLRENAGTSNFQVWHFK